jgi:hypothetical protein
MSWMRVSAVAGVAVAALALGACGSDSGGAVTASSLTTAALVTTTTITPTTATTATTPTEPATTLGDSTDTGKSELEDGRHFGYWSTFEIGDTIAFGEFDLAYFLTGDEAQQAAAKKGETVEDDYYIVNDNPKLRTLIVDGHADVQVLASEGSSDLVASNVADFAVDRHKSSGFWLTIAGGKVTKIEEQFVP